MKLKSVKSFIFFLFISYFFMILFSVSCLGAPVVEELYHSPFEPLPLSTVKFNAGIYNNSTEIEEVKLVAQECMDDLCFIDGQNISMNYTYSCCMDFYEVEVNLNHEDATQVKYHLEIKSNGTWHEYEQDFISLSISAGKETADIVENATPGFGYISLIMAVFCAFVLKKVF